MWQIVKIGNNQADSWVELRCPYNHKYKLYSTYLSYPEWNFCMRCRISRYFDCYLPEHIELQVKLLMNV